MKIHTHLKLGFAILLLTGAHLQMKQGGNPAFLDPEIVAAVVLIVMGSVFVGTPKSETEDIKSPFLEKNDDYDLTA
jgi:hypothetical protein